MLRNRSSAGEQERAHHRRRDKLGVIAVGPVELFPDQRAFSIVLKISQRVVPVARQGDFLARQTPAVLQPALANHRLEPGFAEIGAEGKAVLPGADQNDIPFVIGHHLAGFPKTDWNDWNPWNDWNTCGLKISFAKRSFCTPPFFPRTLSCPFRPCRRVGSCRRRAAADKFPCA